MHLSTAPVRSERGALSEWDKVRLRDIFAEADADGSGSLSLDEMLGAMRAAADLGFCLTGDDAENSVRRLFEQLDADGSGAVDWREFSEAISSALLELDRPASPSSSEDSEEDDADAVKPRRPRMQPAVRFRPLTKQEASTRAERLFARAKTHLDAVARLSPGEEREHNRKQAQELARRATRLHEMATRLDGRFDPPERPPTPPPARRDVFAFIAAVPEREARKTLRRGNRKYDIPKPGQESDSETDSDTEKGQGEKWERFRKRKKARKPHVVFRKELTIGGIQD